MNISLVVWNLADLLFKVSIAKCTRINTKLDPEHDFFTPQPVKDADIFLIRGVIHNWSSAYAIKILKQLREAAVPGKTKLLMIDQIVRYACKGVKAEEKGILGSDLAPVPDPLLSNLGANSSYLLDLLYV